MHFTFFVWFENQFKATSSVSNECIVDYACSNDKTSICSQGEYEWYKFTFKYFIKIANNIKQRLVKQLICNCIKLNVVFFLNYNSFRFIEYKRNVIDRCERGFLIYFLSSSVNVASSITLMDNICYLFATKIKNIYSAPKLNIRG